MFKNGIIITGPIGAGKSSALEIINNLGYETVDLDTISNEILDQEDSLKFIKEYFSDCVADEQVNRAKLAKIVFSNKEKLSLLENFLHPKIQNKLTSILEISKGLVFIEVSAPKNMINIFKSIVIWSPVETRIKRLLKRGMDIEDIMNRIENQPNDEWWNSIGTVIENNDEKDFESKLKDTIQTLP